MMKHSTSGKPENIKIFGVRDVESVLRCATSSYFNHFLLLSNCSKFIKRSDSYTYSIYSSFPLIFANSKDTVFVDLSKKEEP